VLLLKKKKKKTLDKVHELFQVDINNYIAGLVYVPTGVKNLADLITFNTEHADLELIPPFYTSQFQ
jgi:amidase